MKRTEILQEVRKMRFEESYEGWKKGSLTQEEAARLLGVFRRYLIRYEEEEGCRVLQTGVWGKCRTAAPLLMK